MNILQLQDTLKNFSQDQLVNEMSSPSGQVPQFMVLSELKRRKKMEADYNAMKNAPTTTVAEDAVAAAGVPGDYSRSMAQNMAPKSDMTNTGIAKMADGGRVGWNPAMEIYDPRLQIMRDWGEPSPRVRQRVDYDPTTYKRSDLYRTRALPAYEPYGRKPAYDTEAPARGDYDVTVAETPRMDYPGELGATARGGIADLAVPPPAPKDHVNNPATSGLRGSVWSMTRTDPQLASYKEVLDGGPAPLDFSDETAAAPAPDLVGGVSGSMRDSIEARKGEGGWGSLFENLGEKIAQADQALLNAGRPVQGPNMPPVQGPEDQPVQGPLGFNLPDTGETIPLVMGDRAELSFGENAAPASGPTNGAGAPGGAGSATGSGKAPAGPSGVDALLKQRMSEISELEEQNKWLSLAKFGVALMSSNTGNLGSDIGIAGQEALHSFGRGLGDVSERRQALEDTELSMMLAREAAAAAAARAGSKKDADGGLSSLALSAGQKRYLDLVLPELDGEIRAIESQLTPGEGGVSLLSPEEDAAARVRLQQLHAERRKIVNRVLTFAPAVEDEDEE